MSPKELCLFFLAVAHLGIQLQSLPGAPQPGMLWLSAVRLIMDGIMDSELRALKERMPESASQEEKGPKVPLNSTEATLRLLDKMKTPANVSYGLPKEQHPHQLLYTTIYTCYQFAKKEKVIFVSC